jgi:hypothetical protein
MGLETGTYIDDLVATNPAGTDVKSQGDDHIRLLKATIKATFPNIDAPVTVTPAELNHLAGTTAPTGTGALVRGTAPTISNAVFLGTVTFPAAAIADAALSANIPKKDAANVFTAAQQLTTLELGHASDTTLSRSAAGRLAVEGINVALVAVANVFTQPQQFTTLELGHASDTTLSRIAAGRVAIEGNEIARLAAAQTFTQPQIFQGTPAAGNTTGAKVRHADGADHDAGLNVMPFQGFTADDVIDPSHVGQVLRHTGATGHNLTTPASTDTDVPLGAIVNVLTVGSGAVTILAGSGVTLTWFSGAAVTNGTRTLSIGGVATLWRLSASVWYVWGNGGLA